MLKTDETRLASALPFVENGLRHTKYCGRATYAHYILWSRGLFKEYNGSDQNARIARARTRDHANIMRQNSALSRKICCTTDIPRGTIRVDSDVQDSRAWQPSWEGDP